MTWKSDELKTWPHWEFSEDLMVEIKRRELYSVFDIKTDVNGNVLADNNVPEPEMLVLAVCEMLEITDPFSGEKLQKSEFGMIIVVVDVFVVIFILLFTWTLEIGQENFVKIYDKGTIEMSDFSLRVKKMPDESKYSPEMEEVAKAEKGYTGYLCCKTKKPIDIKKESAK
jgi:hypothetical protein